MSAKKRFLEWMGENKPIFDGMYHDGEPYYYEAPSQMLEELAKEMSEDE